MKKLLILLLFPTIVFAQTPITIDKPVVCNWVSVVLDTLREKYQEEPVWVGNDRDRSKYTVFVNPKNGQFTIIQFNNEIACILGAGEFSLNIPQKPTL